MQERDRNMTITPVYKWKQPHVEQAHRTLVDALAELGKAQAHAAILDDDLLIKALGEVEYLILTVVKALPPKQLTLPF